LIVTLVAAFLFADAGSGERTGRAFDSKSDKPDRWSPISRIDLSALVVISQVSRWTELSQNCWSPEQPVCLSEIFAGGRGSGPRWTVVIPNPVIFWTPFTGVKLRPRVYVVSARHPNAIEG